MKLKDVLFKRVPVKNHKNLDFIRGLSRENLDIETNSAFLRTTVGDSLDILFFDEAVSFSSPMDKIEKNCSSSFLLLRLSTGVLVLRNTRVSVDISAFFMRDFPFLEEEGYELLTAAYPELDAGILKEVANLELESRRKYDLVG